MMQNLLCPTLEKILANLFPFSSSIISIPSDTQYQEVWLF